MVDFLAYDFGVCHRGIHQFVREVQGQGQLGGAEGWRRQQVCQEKVVLCIRPSCLSKLKTGSLKILADSDVGDLCYSQWSLLVDCNSSIFQSGARGANRPHLSRRTSKEFGTCEQEGRITCNPDSTIPKTHVLWM